MDSLHLEPFHKIKNVSSVELSNVANYFKRFSIEHGEKSINSFKKPGTSAIFDLNTKMQRIL